MIDRDELIWNYLKLSSSSNKFTCSPTKDISSYINTWILAIPDQNTNLRNLRNLGDTDNTVLYIDQKCDYYYEYANFIYYNNNAPTPANKNLNFRSKNNSGLSECAISGFVIPCFAAIVAVAILVSLLRKSSNTAIANSQINVSTDSLKTIAIPHKV